MNHPALWACCVTAATAAVLAATGCDPAASAFTPDGAAPTGSGEPEPTSAPDEPRHVTQGSPSDDAPPNPDDELRALDTRQGVPLPPAFVWAANRKMQAMLAAVQRIQAGIATEDWAAVGEAVTILEAPPQNPEMRDTMGVGAPGFAELAAEFRTRAAAIRTAAAAQDGSQVLLASSSAVQACVACHESYRWEPVDPATWARLVAE